MINIIQKLGSHAAIAECTRCNSHYEVRSKYSAMKSPVGHLCKGCKTLISRMIEPDQAGLKEAFVYYPESGDLRFKHTTLSGKEGDLATYAHSGGYLSVSVGKKQLLAHRVIYMMMTGEWPEFIDHIDHNRANNAWSNLRSVKQADNNRNMPIQINSRTGITGVCLHQPTGKYRSYITCNGKQKHLGLYGSIAAAQAAREHANSQFGYHINHGK